MQSITSKCILLSVQFSSLQRTITTNAKILFSVGGIIKSYILISFFFIRKDINQVIRWKNAFLFQPFYSLSNNIRPTKQFFIYNLNIFLKREYQKILKDLILRITIFFQSILHHTSELKHILQQCSESYISNT